MSTPELVNKRLDGAAFAADRESVVQSWPTGNQVDFESGVSRQLALPESMRFASALATAEKSRRTLLQPRAGVALIREQSALLNAISPYCDLLPTTIDAYTRHNRYAEAQAGIDRSRTAGTSLLNGALLCQKHHTEVHDRSLTATVTALGVTWHT